MVLEIVHEIAGQIERRFHADILFLPLWHVKNRDFMPLFPEPSG
jgi:hypothetical protein